MRMRMRREKELGFINMQENYGKLGFEVIGTDLASRLSSSGLNFNLGSHTLFFYFCSYIKPKRPIEDPATPVDHVYILPFLTLYLFGIITTFIASTTRQ